MCGKANWPIWLGLLAAVCGAMPAPSQIGAFDKAPIDIETVVVETPEGQRVASRVRNLSEKEIVAYAAYEPRGTSGSAHERTHVAILATARPLRNRLRPGEVIEDRLLQEGQLQGMPFKVSRPIVDYVLFADGSSWGPDSKKQSLRIWGVIEGRRATIAELRRVMETQGLGAVEQILKSDEQ